MFKKIVASLSILFLLSGGAFAQTMVPINEKVPNFSLTDHRGDSVSFSDLKGKTVLITFLYTTCPFPDKCPMLKKKLVDIQSVVAKFPESQEKLAVLAVTLDPEKDTVESLGPYVKSQKMNKDYFHYLTGTKEDIYKVASLFGVVFWEDKGVIDHNMNTVVIDSEGYVRRYFPGNEWMPGQVSATIFQMIER